MPYCRLKPVIIFMATLTLLVGNGRAGLCAIDMDEVKDRFFRQTGNQWSDVSSEERREFLYEALGRKRIEQRQKRVEGETVPFHIKEGFQRAHNKHWNAGTEAEQQLFIKNYKRYERNWNREEILRERKEKIKERNLQREISLEKRKKAMKERAKLREERIKHRNEVLEKTKEKRKLLQAGRKRNDMRNKIKRIRETHTREGTGQ